MNKEFKLNDKVKPFPGFDISFITWVTSSAYLVTSIKCYQGKKLKDFSKWKFQNDWVLKNKYTLEKV